MSRHLSKIAIAAALAGGTLAASAGIAAAEHDHYRMRIERSGETHCRYIAHGQTSKDLDDPGGHKFHDNVHNGRPGADGKGTDFNKRDNAGECDNFEGEG